MALEELVSSEEFKEENEREHVSSKSKKDLTPLKIDVEKLRNKFKWLKDQWRRYTDRIKKGSGKSPIQEPEWYRIVNPIFSDTHGNMEVGSQANDVLSDDQMIQRLQTPMRQLEAIVVNRKMMSPQIYLTQVIVENKLLQKGKWK